MLWLVKRQENLLGSFLLCYPDVKSNTAGPPCFRASNKKTSLAPAAAFVFIGCLSEERPLFFNQKPWINHLMSLTTSSSENPICIWVPGLLTRFALYSFLNNHPLVYVSHLVGFISGLLVLLSLHLSPIFLCFSYKGCCSRPPSL